MATRYDKLARNFLGRRHRRYHHLVDLIESGASCACRDSDYEDFELCGEKFKFEP